MSPSQRPLSLECFRVNEVVNVGAGVVAFLLQRGVFAVVCLEESKGTPLATGPAHLVDGAVDFVVAAGLEALATPPAGLAGSWPKAVFGPMVSGCASPTVVILLWAVKGEVVIRIAPEANLSSFILLRLLLFGFFSFLLRFWLLFLRPPLLLVRGRSVSFWFV